MKNILDKLAGKVDSAEIFYMKGFYRSVSYKGWKLHSSSAKEKSGYALRVIVDGKMGTSATTDPNAIDALVQNALDTAKFGEKIDLEFPNTKAAKEVKSYDKEIENLTQKDLIDSGKYFIEKVSQHRGACDLDFSGSTGTTEFEIMNTSGLHIADKVSSVAFFGNLSRVKEGDVFFVGDGFASRFMPENINKEIDDFTKPFNEKLAWADNIVNINSGTFPIVFDPRGTLVLLLPLLRGINGSSIYTGSSPIASKIGEKIFDEKFSLIDDGTLDGKIGSATYDDEGMIKTRLPIVENGVLKNFVFDLTTAKKSGMTPNGCGQRDLFSPPYPSTSNIILENGDVSYEDMIKDIDQGILLESVLGMGQGNILSGAFSNPLGIAYKIENGKVVGRVKDAQIAGNIYDLMKDIHSISNDGKWFRGSFFAPHIRMDNIPIVGK